MPFNHCMQYTYFLLISGIKGNLWQLLYVVVVVLLVQISVNLSVLKDWRLHLDGLATLAEVLEQFKRGEIAECSSFMFPDALLEQQFECYIAPNMSGLFQTGFRCARVFYKCYRGHSFLNK